MTIPRKAPATISMRKALADPQLLGSALPGDTWRAWRVLLIALMGEPLSPEERTVFKALTGRDKEPGARVSEFWGVVGRRGGKSRAMAVLAIYLAVLAPRPRFAPGEKPTVICLAQSRDQASIIHGYVAGAINATPLLARLVKAQSADSVELTTGIVIEVRASNFRTIRGITALAVVADEIAFWFDSASSSNPDTEILNALRPSLLTTKGPLIAISSPYARRGEMWVTYDKHFGSKGDPLILVAQGASRALNPSLPKAEIDRALDRDPIAASAEYLAQFRSDLEAFVSREVVEACVDYGVFERAPLSSIKYFGFVDPSGGSADSFTMAISHREDTRIILDAVREVKPPFSPSNVVSEFADLLTSYRIKSVTGDRYAGEWPREQFRAHGIQYTPSERNKSELFGEMLPLLNASRAALLDNKRLHQQLMGLERRTARSGKDSIDHAPGGHDDLANAVAGVLVMASIKKQYMVISDQAIESAKRMGRNQRVLTF